MSETAPQGERLARIETMLIGVNARLRRMEEQNCRLEAELRADKEALAALKNRGTGILAGVALAAGGISAGISHWWKLISG